MDMVFQLLVTLGGIMLIFLIPIVVLSIPDWIAEWQEYTLKKKKLELEILKERKL